MDFEHLSERARSIVGGADSGGITPPPPLRNLFQLISLCRVSKTGREIV
jgi:hypothetical protein